MKKQFDILVVEDSKTQAENLRFILENKNYTVVNAFNGHEALDVLSDSTPKLIISDIIMPEMDGYTLCSKVKNNPHLKAVPFILLTSLSDTSDIIRGLESGADSFITKPFEKDFLLSKVEYLILNFELRQKGTTEMGLEILFGGQKHLITSDRLQILDLLISTYESAVIKNRELQEANKELKFSKNQLLQFNKNLEKAIEERTQDVKQTNKKLIDEINERISALKKQDLIVKILSILNRPNEWIYLIRDILFEIKEFSGVNAVAIRLHHENDYPYFDTHGFSSEFTNDENKLCIRDKSGNPVFDKKGKPVLACLCGNVLSENPDTSYPNFTKAGSFWTNSTSTLISEFKNNKAIGRLRNRCNKEGFESVALVPVIAGEVKIGLIQLNHKKVGKFSNEEVEFFEEIATTIGIAYKRVQIEKRIKESEARYKKLFNEDLTGNFIKKPDGTIILCNPVFAQIFGFNSAADALGQNFTNLYLDPNDHDIMIREIYAKGKLKESNIWMKHLDGHPIHIIWNSVGTFNDKGELTEITGYIFNDTKRKLAEDEVLQERAKLQTLIKNLPDPIFVKDNQGRKIVSNPADLKNVCLSDEQNVIGKTDLELFEGEIGIRSYNDDMEVIEKGKPVLNREEIFIDQNGNQRWYLTSKIPIFDNKGKTNGLVGIGKDITERIIAHNDLKIALEKAQIADRLKSSFLATMSHELRTPLNAVIGFSSLIDKETSMNDVVNFSRIIQSSGNQLLEIIQNILDFSMIESGIIQIKKSKFQLSKILNESYLRILSEKERMSKKEIEIIFNPELNNSDLIIESDEEKFSKTLNYLLSNALKFTEQGNIEFGYTKTSKNRNSFFEFFVRDTGIGIPKEKQELIFEMFRQADDTNTRKYGGTGLGLAISKKLVELLGGSIRVESEPEKGSAFYFTIPAVEVQNKIEKTEQKELAVGKTILIVEDDEVNFELLKIYLAKFDINILWTTRGDEAVEICRTNPAIDLILMDVNLPGISGNEATRLIKQIRPKLPIIIQSAYTVDNNNQWVSQSGCDDYLLKPIQKQTLHERIFKFIK